MFSVAMLGVLATYPNGKVCAQKDTKTPGNERPNILFILSDDHTSQAWGIYGGILADYVHNPNIRRLASEGVVLIIVSVQILFHPQAVLLFLQGLIAIKMEFIH